MTEILVVAMKIALALVGGLVLLGAFRVFGVALTLIPRLRSYRAALKRVGPLLALVCLSLYAGLALGYVFGLGHSAWLVVVVVLVPLAAAFGPLRDTVMGVIARSSAFFSVGDTLEVGDLSGRIVEVGYRRLLLETKSGESVAVPFSVVLREPVVRRKATHHAIPHRFVVELPAGEGAEARRRIEMAALGHHWSSIVRAPEFAALDAERWEVTVFALDARYASEIERAVRAHLESTTSPTQHS